MKAIIAGTGISGVCAAGLLLDRGYDVVLFDEKSNKNETVIRASIKGAAQAGDRLVIRLGELMPEDMDGCEMCVMSPGINPRTAPFALQLTGAGVPLVSEIELGYRMGRGRVAAITGTNGKTTTTALLGHIVKAAGLDTFVAGNIGTGYTSIVEQLTDESVTVLEVAGFHLETCSTFAPNVSAILNITPDHLDRFETMERYIRAKEKIAAAQRPEDVIVLNAEDPELARFGASVRPRVKWFSSARELEEGAFIRGEYIIIREAGAERALCRIGDLQLLGKHNYENVMAAALMALSLGISPESVSKSVLTFKSVEHRIEFVREAGGVTYYNDSKGTNPDASIQAVKAMNRPTVLIAGGFDKHIDFTDWIKVCIGRVRHMVILGACGAQIAATCDKLGFDCYEMADSFDEAVELAHKAARPGDAVLLSPGCASWDMFPNFEVRGRHFKELVNKL